MKSRFLIAVVAFLGYAIIDGTSANAADVYYWTGANPDNDCGSATRWSCGANWEDARIGGTAFPVADYPGSASGDVAIVPNKTFDPTLDVDLDGVDKNPIVSLAIEGDAIVFTAAKKMHITGSGGLDIDADGLLRVDGAGEVRLRASTGGGTHEIDGKIELAVPGSTLRVITANTTLGYDSAPGSVTGQDNGAFLLIDGVTLTNQINIEGPMVINDGTSAGIFQNDGAVIANADGTLDMQVATIRDSAGSGRWKVMTHEDARLLFTAEPDALAGSFHVEDGILQAGVDPGGAEHINVVSSGPLTHEIAGEIRVLVDDSFIFNWEIR